MYSSTKTILNLTFKSWGIVVNRLDIDYNQGKHPSRMNKDLLYKPQKKQKKPQKNSEVKTLTHNHPHSTPTSQHNSSCPVIDECWAWRYISNTISRKNECIRAFKTFVNNHSVLLKKDRTANHHCACDARKTLHAHFTCKKGTYIE